jgi:hypothetical protein
MSAHRRSASWRGRELTVPPTSGRLSLRGGRVAYDRLQGHSRRSSAGELRDEVFEAVVHPGSNAATFLACAHQLMCPQPPADSRPGGRCRALRQRRSRWQRRLPAHPRSQSSRDASPRLPGPRRRSREACGAPIRSRTRATGRRSRVAETNAATVGAIGFIAVPIRRREQRTVDGSFALTSIERLLRDFDPANGRRPMSAVPRKPVGGDAIFRLRVRPVVAGCCRPLRSPVRPISADAMRAFRTLWPCAHCGGCEQSSQH